MKKMIPVRMALHVDTPMVATSVSVLLAGKGMTVTKVGIKR